MNPLNVPTASVADIPAGQFLLDVREDDEWAAGHATEAVHIPMGEIAGRLGDLPADQSVYVVCRSGGRSARVTAYLAANGWDATNVEGGMQAWQASGRPMVSETQADPEVL